MTLPYEFGADYDANFESNVAEAELPAVVPVRVVFSENEPVPAQFAACMTWQISNDRPIQVLQRRLHRFKAKIWCPAGFAGQTLFFNSKPDPLTLTTPQGLQMASFFILDWESAQPLYVISSVVAATPLCVLDQSYGQTQ